MSAQLLFHPHTYKIVAELKPEENLVIYDESLKNRIDESGIAVYSEFRKKYNTTISRVYPDQGAALCAQAFEHCFYEYELKKIGYFWKDKEEYYATLNLPIQESAERILEAYKKAIGKA